MAFLVCITHLFSWKGGEVVDEQRSGRRTKSQKALGWMLYVPTWMTWPLYPSVWPWTSPSTSLSISARTCVCGVCVCACVHWAVGRCHHISNAVAEASSLGKRYRSLLAPIGKIFSQCSERCHFLITSLEYQLSARYSGTHCGVPSCDMIKKRLPCELPGKAPSGSRAWSFWDHVSEVETWSLSHCRKYTDLSWRSETPSLSLPWG